MAVNKIRFCRWQVEPRKQALLSPTSIFYVKEVGIGQCLLHHETHLQEHHDFLTDAVLQGVVAGVTEGDLIVLESIINSN